VTSFVAGNAFFADTAIGVDGDPGAGIKYGPLSTGQLRSK